MTENFSSFSTSPTASLKSFGEKTASLFDRKKKDAEKLAADKAAEAQKIAEEQARKVGEEIGKTKSEAEALAASTGEECGWEYYRLSGRERKEIQNVYSSKKYTCLLKLLKTFLLFTFCHFISMIQHSYFTPLLSL